MNSGPVSAGPNLCEAMLAQPQQRTPRSYVCAIFVKAQIPTTTTATTTTMYSLARLPPRFLPLTPNPTWQHQVSFQLARYACLPLTLLTGGTGGRHPDVSATSWFPSSLLLGSDLKYVKRKERLG